MKAVMISIQPQWCELIASGKKTVEVRKSKPKLGTPFKVYIYCTQGKQRSSAWSGKVIGEFVCDRIYQYASDLFRSVPVEGVDISTEEMSRLSCLTAKELYEYEHSAEPQENCIYLVGVFGWHISNLVIYDKPKELKDFRKPCICPEMPYCPSCPVGGEYISESELEFLAIDGECNTEWYCNNYVERPPQSWCYVEETIDGK